MKSVFLAGAVTWGANGLSYEVDQSHAETTTLELKMRKAKSASTPGSREDATKPPVTRSKSAQKRQLSNASSLIGPIA